MSLQPRRQDVTSPHLQAIAVSAASSPCGSAAYSQVGQSLGAESKEETEETEERGGDRIKVGGGVGSEGKERKGGCVKAFVK